MTAPTTAANCRVVPNSATASAGNDGSDTDSAQVTVLCPDVTVVKTAVESPVNAGDPIAFDITVSNAGPGVAKSVTLTDTLPAGITWSDDSAACAIADGVLILQLRRPGREGQRHRARLRHHLGGRLRHRARTRPPSRRPTSPADQLTDNSSTASVVVNCPDIVRGQDSGRVPGQRR